MNDKQYNRSIQVAIFEDIREFMEEVWKWHITDPDLLKLAKRINDKWMW